MNRFFVILAVCLYGIGFGAFAQNLSIQEMAQKTLDLTARMERVNDKNGNGCGVIKIVCPDEISKVEGNVIKTVENGNELRVYLTNGTKFIRILTKKHKPLEVDITKYFEEGITMLSTYQLTLESDLPIEILYDKRDSLAPVKMEAAGSPLLPDWWDTQEEGVYVGISCPTLDSNAAKKSALLNAIQTYAMREPVGEFSYSAQLDQAVYSNKWDSSDLGQRYMLALENFKYNILQEYYNNKGEYFVLCTFETGFDDCAFQLSWSYGDDVANNTGEISTSIGLMTRDVKSPITGQYNVKWSDSEVKYDYQIDSKKLVSEDLRSNQISDDYLNLTLHGCLGLNQLRLLNLLPLIPDTIEIWSSMVDNERGRKMEMRAASNTPYRSYIYHLKMDKKGLVNFRIRDYYPEEESVKAQKEMKELNNHFAEKGFASYGLWSRNTEYVMEQTKNRALLHAIYEHGFNDNYDVLSASEDGKKNIDSSSCIGIAKKMIYPIWLLNSEYYLADMAKRDKTYSGTKECVLFSIFSKAINVK